VPGRPPIVEPEPTPLADTELVARLFRALGEATRLRILHLLICEGERHQMAIVREIGASQARVSEHLACLVWCGFVERRVVGRRTLYTVTDPQVRGLLDGVKEFLHRNEAQIASCRHIDESVGDVTVATVQPEHECSRDSEPMCAPRPE
jgi:DNA-binding transcriptional ArsR family regulator